MKKIYFLLIFNVLLGDAMNVELLGFLPYDQDASDITGFAQDNREFAVMGLLNGTTFIDVTDPYNPFEVGYIPGSNSIWRDVKYWDKHVYIGTEADDGIQVVDVTNLDNPTLVYTILDVDNSHNVHIDADGYLYIVGADTYDIWIYDLSTPSLPNLVGTWSGEYLHDIEVYNDKIYGAAIYSGLFYIIDVSDKSNPQTLVSYDTGGGYISTHDCAITFDEQFLITADETLGGYIKIFDISDYNNINLISSYFTPENETHTAHNVYIQESSNLMIISYYADGTRFVDISDPYNPIEVGYYDMSDLEDLYVSNWGTYVDLPSGNIISSDIEQGLFVLKFGGLSIQHTPLSDVDANSQVLVSALVTSMNSNVEDVKLYYNANGSWYNISMISDGNDLFSAEIQNISNPSLIRYYITASDNFETNARYPLEGSFMFTYGELEIINENDFEVLPVDWTIGDLLDDATAGIWEWGNPNGTNDQNGLIQPEDDHTLNGNNCFITGNGDDSIGSDDVDNGTTTLFSPIFDLTGLDDALLTYWRWFSNDAGDNPGNDYWSVKVTGNGGDSWVNLENTTSSERLWKRQEFLLSDYIDISNSVQFKFVAEDLEYNGDNGSGGSIIEAAIDDFSLKSIYFNQCTADGDTNNDNIVNILDIVIIINAILDQTLVTDSLLCSGDLNQDSILNILDVVNLINLILYE